MASACRWNVTSFGPELPNIEGASGLSAVATLQAFGLDMQRIFACERRVEEFSWKFPRNT